MVVQVLKYPTSANQQPLELSGMPSTGNIVIKAQVELQTADIRMPRLAQTDIAGKRKVACLHFYKEICIEVADAPSTAVP